MLRGENLLSYLFLYQQIKLTSKTSGMCREQYLMVLCKSSIPAHDLWFLLSWAGGHWECRELFFTPLYFLSINRVQLLLPVCHWLARRVFWQLCPWDKRDLLSWAHLAVRSVVLCCGSISHTIHVWGVVGSVKSIPAPCGIFWSLLKIGVFKPSLEKCCFCCWQTFLKSGIDFK